MTPVLFNKANGKDIIAMMPLKAWKKFQGADPFIEYSFSYKESVDLADGLADILKYNKLTEIFGTPRVRTDIIVHAIDEDMIKVVACLTATNWVRLIKFKNKQKVEDILTAIERNSPL